MPITEDEFRSLLVERSEHLTPPPDQVARVHRRIARRQLRVRAGAVAAVAVAIATVAAVGFSRPSGHRPAPVIHHGETGPPEYAYGGHLLAGAVLHSPQQGSVTVRFTPTSWRLIVRTGTHSQWWPSTFGVVTVNGHPLGGREDFPSEVGGLFATKGDEQRYWSKLGVRLGQPSTVTLTLTSRLPKSRVVPTVQPARDRVVGTATLGVYQRVPVADYPLPSPPMVVQSLPVGGPLPALDSRLVGSTGHWHLTVRAGRDVHVLLSTVAPGQLRLLLDGRPLLNYESWDYTGRGAILDLSPRSLRHIGLSVREGERVDLAVEANRFTLQGWIVRLVDGRS